MAEIEGDMRPVARVEAMADAAAAPLQKRDLLGNFCFYLHLAVMVFVVGGWLLPWRAALVVHLVMVPGMVLIWQLNKDTCILNNIENWLRDGKWRNKEANPEEGAWLLTLARNVTGFEFSATFIDRLTYSVLVLAWLVSLARLFGRF